MMHLTVRYDAHADRWWIGHDNGVWFTPLFDKRNRVRGWRTEDAAQVAADMLNHISATSRSSGGFG